MSSDTAPIHRFMTRVRQATQSGVKDIRLTLPEATELAACLGQVMASKLDLTPSGAAPSGATGQNDGSYHGPVGRVTVMDGGTLKR